MVLLDPPWEHPDWYDLHDTAFTAGSEREPEHYRELLLSLPPLDRQHHLCDVGAGTGKLAALIAQGYPRLGHVTLMEPNGAKLERALERLAKLLPLAQLLKIEAGLGEKPPLPAVAADIVTVGSVFMPVMELRGGTLGDGLAWMRQGLAEVLHLLRPGGWLYALETTALPWARGSLTDPVRRLTFLEFTAELTGAGFANLECIYRFRDRVLWRGQKPV
jgi:ubiquinone/menaquinone biosynthesis C-methylase UbiE